MVIIPPTSIMRETITVKDAPIPDVPDTPQTGGTMPIIPIAVGLLMVVGAVVLVWKKEDW